MTEEAKHTHDAMRGKIKLSDFKPSNLHPKAKFRISMALIGTFLLIFGCIFMLSTATIAFNPDVSTPAGLSAFFKDLVAIGYVVGTIFVIILLWCLMIKDCPISPAAKWNYQNSHDKSIEGVKLITAVANAVANKGSGNSIDSVATALDNYLEEKDDEKEKQTINPKARSKKPQEK